MVGADSVEHHSRLLRRAAPKALLGEPFEEDLPRAIADLGSAAAGFHRADAAALLGRVAANLRGDIRSAAVSPSAARAGEVALVRVVAEMWP